MGAMAVTFIITKVLYNYSFKNDNYKLSNNKH